MCGEDFSHFPPDTGPTGPPPACVNDSSAPSRLDEAPGRFAVDIDVPYADQNRNHVLLSEWRRQGSELLPAPRLTLPRRSEGSYKVRIRQRNMLDLVVEDQYSDAVAGGTGGVNGHLEDRIVTHVTLRGKWRFASAQQTSTVGAGLLCVRRNDEPWDFEVDRGTQAIALVLPARDVCFPRSGRGITAEQNAPAARLLLAHLRNWADLSGDLGPAASQAARNATLELFHGLLNDQVIDDEQFSPALVRAAMEYIESRLLADPDLDPRSIATSLHVSVRTLYRAFAKEATSVMEYVRERRLERARAELTSTSSTVSEIAARWHFTDSSHFIRAYKKRFDETPTAHRHS